MSEKKVAFFRKQCNKLIGEGIRNKSIEKINLPEYQGQSLSNLLLLFPNSKPYFLSKTNLDYDSVEFFMYSGMLKVAFYNNICIKAIFYPYPDKSLQRLFVDYFFPIIKKKTITKYIYNILLMNW